MKPIALAVTIQDSDVQVERRQSGWVGIFERLPWPSVEWKVYPEGEPLREAIVIDELTEEEQFDGIRRSEHQLGQVEPELADRLASIGKTDAAGVSNDDMRQFVHSHCWEAAGVEDNGEEASDA